MLTIPYLGNSNDFNHYSVCFFRLKHYPIINFKQVSLFAKIIKQLIQLCCCFLKRSKIILTQNTPPFHAQHWSIRLTIRGSLKKSRRQCKNWNYMSFQKHTEREGNASDRAADSFSSATIKMQKYKFPLSSLNFKLLRASFGRKKRCFKSWVFTFQFSFFFSIIR